jgi:AcrR family transcriptional regulator
MPDQPALSRRDRRRLSTREEILIAARELLLEVGPEALSLRQVARRTDFSPAALYTYFASRDDIIAALFAESFQRLDAFLRRVPPELPADRRVVELGMAYLDFARENPIDLRCILAATIPEELPSSSGVGLGLGAAQLIAETFQEGMEKGIFATGMSLSAAEMAYTTWALVHGMAVVSTVNMRGVEEIISADPRRALEAFIGLLTTPTKPR